VDDEPQVLDGLRRILHGQRHAWDVRYAHNGREALARLQEEGADVVSSDVVMPEMDGFELLQALRADPALRDIPVIILTGCQEHGLKQRALDLGAVDLLTKPVDADELRARLANMLRLKSYQDQIKTQAATLQQQVEARTAELAASRLDVIWRLAKLAEFRDEDTGNHVVRVSFYCRALAEALGLDKGVAERLFLTSPLHDIGKIAISDAILRKRGRLTPEERQVMQQHCVIGAEILRQDFKTAGTPWALEVPPVYLSRALDDSLLRSAAVIAEAHHERWDGAGYPRRLAGGEIPLEARLVALADVYDALCSARPYKPALPEDEVCGLIRAEAGRHFDPEVSAAFEKAHDQFRAARARFPDRPTLPPEALGAP
jgi:putative two-component system response regulator